MISFYYIIATLLIAFCSAFIGGIVGIGGALISLPIYLIIFDNNFDEASLYSFVGMAFLSIVSVFKYIQQKTIPSFKKTLSLVSGTTLGLFISMLYIQPWMQNAGLENNIFLNIILIMILVVVSFLIFFQNKIPIVYVHDIFLLPVAIIGSIISSILGIGISTILLPILLFLYGMNGKTIPVITLLISAMIAIASILERTFVLNIHLINHWIIIPLAIGSIIGAILGPIFNKMLKMKYVMSLNIAVRILAIITTIVSMIIASI